MANPWKFCPNCGANLTQSLILTKITRQSWHAAEHKALHPARTGGYGFYEGNSTCTDESSILQCRACLFEFEHEFDIILDHFGFDGYSSEVRIL